MHLTGQQNLDAYMNNVVHSSVYTIGGPPFRADFTIGQWEDQLLNELIAVDRSGEPLHFAITPGSLPEMMSETLTFDVAEVVKNATLLYYETNKHTGCTKMDSPNFSFRANFDDDFSCKSPTNNYTFGGVFQECNPGGSDELKKFCKDLDQKNPLTSDYSCPAGYKPILITSGYVPTDCYDPANCYTCRYNPQMYTCNVNCKVDLHHFTYWCAAIGAIRCLSIPAICLGESSAMC